MTRTLVVAEMATRDLVRRRGVLVLLALMPMAFYLARRDSSGLAIRFMTLGLAWMVSTAASRPSGRSTSWCTRQCDTSGDRPAQRTVTTTSSPKSTSRL